LGLFFGVFGEVFDLFSTFRRGSYTQHIQMASDENPGTGLQKIGDAPEKLKLFFNFLAARSTNFF
jgi:hypothetical protein